MVIPTGGVDTVCTFEMQPDYKKLLLGSNKEIQFNGDLEVLVMLDTHLNFSSDAHKMLLQKMRDDPEFYASFLDNKNSLKSLLQMPNLSIKQVCE